MVPENPPLTSEVTAGIAESRQDGVVVLSPVGRPVRRRVIYVNSYGGASIWEKIKRREMPPQHLWGFIQLVRQGYAVALAEPLPDFYLYRNPFPHDLRLLRLVRRWLGPDGIIFCGHNVLYWMLFLKKCGLIRCRIVSNLWAREPLDFAPAHSAIVALTAAGEAQARKLAPQVPVSRLAWGADLSAYPAFPYRPEAFFSCGITLRDFKTISLGAARFGKPVEVVCPGLPEGISWPPNVRLIDGGKGYNCEEKKVSYAELLEQYYARSAGSLIILKNDPIEYTAVGFTQLIEVLAMARPILMTRTGALPSQIDVEKEGCGLLVPPEDPEALARAMKRLAENPQEAEAMGRRGRQLAEGYYNIDRYARDLDRLFCSL